METTSSLEIKALKTTYIFIYVAKQISIHLNIICQNGWRRNLRIKKVIPRTHEFYLMGTAKLKLFSNLLDSSLRLDISLLYIFLHVLVADTFSEIHRTKFDCDRFCRPKIRKNTESDGSTLEIRATLKSCKHRCSSHLNEIIWNSIHQKSL